MKMYIWGLDGASFDLINKLMKAAKLPNFSKLVKECAYLKLRSTTPPHTAPGWVSAFTGVNPGKHGVYQFWDTQEPSYQGRLIGRLDWSAKPVWNILNSCGVTTGIINVPMTHPPEKVDGYMISWPLSNTLRYSNPEHILKEISEQGGHFASDINCMYDGTLQYIERAIDITKKRLKTLELMSMQYSTDLIISVFTEIDRISHFYWSFMEELELSEDSKIHYVKTAIEDIYIETDKVLGSIIKNLPKDAVLMILSDHGFGKGSINFYVQTYLMKHGYLHTKPLKKEKKQSLAPWMKYEKDGCHYEVDLENTIAYMAAPGSYGVNINLKGRQIHGIVEKKEYEKVRDELILLLQQVKHPYHATPIFKQILRREEVYTGEALDKAPDLILIPNDYGIMVHHAIVPGRLFGAPEHNGMHREDGILMLFGKSLNKPESKMEARIEDIAPTILNYFNIKPPAYMDGKPVILFHLDEQMQLEDERFEIMNDTDSSEQKVRYDKEEMQTAEEKLKSLGYL
jgi:Uncharacterized conserved protein